MIKLQDGAEVAKSCPNDGAKLVIRTKGKDGTQFLACPNYPDCKHTEPIPQSMIMRAMGQPTLL